MPAEWKIVITVKESDRGPLMNIDVQPGDVFADTVHAMLYRALKFYDRQLQALQNVQTMAELKANEDVFRRIKLS